MIKSSVVLIKSNLEFAKKVYNKIKEEVVSLNDIIPQTELPEYSPELFHICAKSFGIETITEYQRLLTHYKKFRTQKLLEDNISSLEKQNKLAPATTAHIALTKLGAGECIETSHLAYCLLLLEGCGAEVSFVTLTGHKPISVFQPYEHVFLVIGEWQENIKTIKDFKTFGDDHILLDPAFGIVGKANEIEKLAGKYLKTFNLEISARKTLHGDSGLQSTAEQVLENAENIAKQIAKDLNIVPFKRTKESISSIALSLSSNSIFSNTNNKKVNPEIIQLLINHNHNTNDKIDDVDDKKCFMKFN